MSEQNQNQNQNKDQQKAAKVSTGMTVSLSASPAEIVKPEVMSGATTFCIVGAIACPLLFYGGRLVARWLFGINPDEVKPALTVQEIKEGIAALPDGAKHGVISATLGGMSDDGKGKIASWLTTDKSPLADKLAPKVS